MKKDTKRPKVGGPLKPREVSVKGPVQVELVDQNLVGMTNLVNSFLTNQILRESTPAEFVKMPEERSVSQRAAEQKRSDEIDQSEIDVQNLESIHEILPPSLMHQYY